MTPSYMVYAAYNEDTKNLWVLDSKHTSLLAAQETALRWNEINLRARQWEPVVIYKVKEV